MCSVAGVNCYDFSSMGARKQYLGKSGPAFVVWAAERWLADEDFFIAECVVGFDDEALADLMDGKFKMYTLRACPSLFGLPITRDRKYMVFLSNRLSWHPAISALGCAEAFQKLFAKQVVMRGDGLLRAPPSAVKEFIAKLATRRDLPQQRSRGGGWSNFLVMTPAQKTSLLKHEDALETAGLPPKAAVLTNLAQWPEHIGPVLSGHVPALLRRSSLWSFRLRRMVLPEELFEIQGYNIFGDGASASTLKGAMSIVKDSAKKSLCGNGMHVQAIGSALIPTFRSVRSKSEREHCVGRRIAK